MPNFSPHQRPLRAASPSRRAQPWGPIGLRAALCGGALLGTTACSDAFLMGDDPVDSGEQQSGVGAAPVGDGVGGDGNPVAGVGGSGTSNGDPDACEGGPAVSSKRLVRLSFNQVANSIATLVDAALGPAIAEEYELVDAEHRAFPPLQSPREGNSFTDQSWSAVDQIAQDVGFHVAQNVATLTSCGAEPELVCVSGFLTSTAEKAYRRPLTLAEGERFAALMTSFEEAGASALEILEHGVYAIFQSPHFLYRTEFGMVPAGEGELTALELASMLSYFLTDDTPDADLLNAAKAGGLSTPQQVEAQVERILQTDAAKENLHGAMMSYLAYPNLESQIIQDDAFTGEMRRSMYTEAELFLEQTLWSGQLSDLLVSRTAYVNEVLAPIYGFTTFPPAGAVPQDESFFQVELPAERTGLLTQAGFLANRSRPDHTSVVGRGLLIKNAFLCTETPPPTDAVVELINRLNETNPDASERELAEIRMSTPTCGKCHQSFDAYGLALEPFDVLGRHRLVDPHGMPIDSTVELPVEIGGGEAKDIVEVAQKLAASGAFAKCMGQNLINYALADVSAGAAHIKSCAVEDVAESFAGTDGSFSSLIKAVATSSVFSQRASGEPQ